MFTKFRNIDSLKRISYGYKNIKECTRKASQGNKFPKRIFSGIQPSGDIHVGNYIGAIAKWVQLQNSEESVIWSIVDLHAITLPHDPKELRDNVLKITATLLACGIDPKKSILFQQSTVPMHVELSWILSSLTTLARLSRIPQFKEKSENLKNIPLTLYIYPVLQAADILLYRATCVPVGQDQLQHIQLAHELAEKFNKRYGDTFALPHSLIDENESGRIKSLRDPSKKMSKSNPDQKSTLNLLDTPCELFVKIKKAVTDCIGEVRYDPQTRPGVSNLIAIHSAITGKSVDQICSDAKGLQTGQYKLIVADAIIAKFAPIREEYSRLIEEPFYLQEVLKYGTERATEIASVCWHDVRDKIGFKSDVFCKKRQENTKSDTQSIM